MIFQTDLIWYSSLMAGLADLRKNRFVLEDAYSNMMCDPYLKDAYGKKEIENFKAFLDRKIYVFTEHRLPDQATFPCIVIKVGPGDEDKAKDAMGDGYQQDKVDPATLGGVFQSPQILVPPCTPEDYDVMTGQVTFGEDVNLTKSNVYEGQYVYDEVNKKAYQIQLVINDATLLLEEGLNPPPNLTGMTIRPTQNLVGHTRRSIWAWEKVELELFASDAVEVLYLYTIVMTMLIRYKKNLWDARNWAIASVSYSDLQKASPPDDPNNLYGRTISVSGRVEHSAIESTTPLLDGVSSEIRIDDMKTPDAILDQVEHQGWEGEEDP